MAKIPEPYFSTIKESIYKLSEDSKPSGHKKLKGRNAFQIRVSNYRITYEIQDKIFLIDVIAIGHRKEIYE